MTDTHHQIVIVGVALLAEGVDRNSFLPHWTTLFFRVALLAEGVDRNIIAQLDGLPIRRRPPRGGRG